jgi:uncharacterized protein YjbI with pentapeptide repeats
MANQEHLAILEQGVERWNQWRTEHYQETPDLSGTYFSGVGIFGFDQIKTIFSEANLKGADISKVDLGGVNFSRANFSGADLSGAYLIRANLKGANLKGANLSSANLSSADLSGAILVETTLIGATLTNCNIYGISVWNVQLQGAIQSNLVITPEEESTITVDNLRLLSSFTYFSTMQKSAR